MDEHRCQLYRVGNTGLVMLGYKCLIEIGIIGTHLQRLRHSFCTPNIPADLVVLVAAEDILCVQLLQTMHRCKISIQIFIESNALGRGTIGLEGIAGDQRLGLQIVPANAVVIMSRGVDQLQSSRNDLPVLHHPIHRNTLQIALGCGAVLGKFGAGLDGIGHGIGHFRCGRSVCGNLYVGKRPDSGMAPDMVAMAVGIQQPMDVRKCHIQFCQSRQNIRIYICFCCAAVDQAVFIASNQHDACPQTGKRYF